MIKTEIVEAIIDLELNEAIKEHGKKYKSLHEAYGVLREELEETVEELTYVMKNFNESWEATKEDDFERAETAFKGIYISLIEMLREGVQVGAVALKALDSIEEMKEKKENE